MLRSTDIGDSVNSLITRRSAVIGVAASTVSPAQSAHAAEYPPFANLEERSGGRLGVYAFEVGTGRSISWRAGERFLMCSTFKLLAVAATLARIDAGRESPNRALAYSKADLVEPYPVTGANVSRGSMSIEALCEAAVVVSDSTAANLLLRNIGGPRGLTDFCRSLGDRDTRQDRYELAANRPDGPLDTTTPSAMAFTTARLLFGGALRQRSRDQLEAWMTRTTPGLNRIRAGVPEGWRAGDRPGTSPRQTNDVAILRPPHRPALVVAAYYDAPGLPPAAREQVLRSVGGAVASWLG